MGSIYYPPSQCSEAAESVDGGFQSSGQELSRILAWDNQNPNGMSSHASDATIHGHGSSVSREEVQPSIIRRTTTTTTTTTFEPSTATASSSVSAGAVAGLLGVGVAVGMGVGAALTYTSMKNETNRQPMQQRPRDTFQYTPSLVDRSQGPERFTILAPSQSVASYQQHYSHEGPMSTYGPQDHAYTEVRGPRSVYSGSPRSVISESKEPLLLVASEHRSRVGSQIGSQVGSRVASQVGSQVGSRVGSRVGSQVGSRVGSQVGSRVGSQARSQVGSQAGSQAMSQHSAMSRGNPHYPRAELETASYVSARSHRSSSTIRLAAVPPPASSQAARSIAPSKPGSAVSVSTVKGPAASRCGSSATARAGRGGSVVSARYVALPESVVSGSRSTILDNDAESLAPSDSISCIGSRRSTVHH